MSFAIDAGNIKCPSCNNIETMSTRSSSLKRARVLNTVQTGIAHNIEEKEQPKRKKTKKKKEKRLHKFRSRCPSNIEDRIYRAENQRMFMISSEEVNDVTRKY